MLLRIPPPVGAAAARCHPRPAAHPAACKGGVPMPPRLAHRVLVAALVVGAFAALASSQPLAVAAATSAETQGFVPLWQSAHSQRADIPSLSSHATMSLPEDAAWEGFVTPANRAAGASPLPLEWQGNTGLSCCA